MTLISQIQSDPGCIAARITSPKGLTLVFRPVSAADAPALGRYFLGLSAETKSLYGPHPFDQPTADRLCAEIDYTHTIRMVGEQGNGEIIAYFILQMTIPEYEMNRYTSYGITLDPSLGCLVAPSVADAYQNQGIGSPLMRHILNVARDLQKRYVLLMGGVYAHNLRAIHYYQKHGFRQVGTFEPTWKDAHTSHDMFVDFDAPAA